MPKIFCGSDVYEVSNIKEAYGVMDEIARRALGTFDGFPCRETGFYVDKDSRINLGNEKHLYRIRGVMGGTYYAETDNPELF